MTQQNSFKPFFDTYIKAISQIEKDLRFRKHFLSISIEKYIIENPENREVFVSGFSTFNIPLDGTNGWLKTSKETFSIEINDLHEHSNNFFIWIMNLALLRAYNSAELLLLQAIQLKYFPTLENPLKGKKQLKKVVDEVINYLNGQGEAIDTKNNRHLISFIRLNSGNFGNFLLTPININW